MGHPRRRRPSENKETTGARQGRLEALICEEVNDLLRGEVRDPRLEGVLVTFVELARDGSCARLWFNGAADVQRPLERAAGFLRLRLAESLALKRTPELRFKRDVTALQIGPSRAEGEI